MESLFNSIVDRGLSEHTGSALFTKKSNGKYSFFLPLTNLGEIGSTPEQLEKTVIGNMAKTYVSGRKDNPQQTQTFYIHRDNLRLVEEYKGKELDFIRVFPDMSAVIYSGQFDYKINDTALNALEQGETSITITNEPQVIDNAFALIEDTAMFTSSIPEMVQITGKGTHTLNITTNPADATITANSDTTGVATANYTGGKLTITGVADGSAVVELTVSKEGYNSFKRTILVIVSGN